MKTAASLKKYEIVYIFLFLWKLSFLFIDSLKIHLCFSLVSSGRRKVFNFPCFETTLFLFEWAWMTPKIPYFLANGFHLKEIWKSQKFKFWLNTYNKMITLPSYLLGWGTVDALSGAPKNVGLQLLTSSSSQETCKWLIEMHYLCFHETITWIPSLWWLLSITFLFAPLIAVVCTV